MPTVRTAGALFQELCYQNKDHLMAGIIVAGWDEKDGPSVYNVPLGGSLHKAPFAIGGMFTTILQQIELKIVHRFRIYIYLRLL